MEVKETLTVYSISNQCDTHRSIFRRFFGLLASSESGHTAVTIYKVLKLTSEILAAQHLYILVDSNIKPADSSVITETITSMGGVLIQLSLARRAMRAGLNNRSSSSSSSLYHILALGGPHSTRNALPN